MMTIVKYFICLLAFGGLCIAAPVLAEETVCIQCHGAQEGRLGAPVAAWRESIHAQNGISCHNCHGGDPTDFAMAMSPERGFLGKPSYTEVPAFCGRCHIGVKEDYLASAHGRALEKGGPQCVVCHDNHRVNKASLDLINPQSCSRCHPYDRAEIIKAAVSDTDQMLDGLETNLQALGKQGIAVKKMEGTTFALRNDFHRLFHSVDVEKVHRETKDILQRGGELQKQLDAIHDELGQRKLWGGIVAGLFFLASMICFLMRKTYHHEENS